MFNVLYRLDLLRFLQNTFLFDIRYIEVNAFNLPMMPVMFNVKKYI